MGISGYHIYESYAIDSQAVANQLNIGITIPTNVSKGNPFNFTIGFEPTKHGFSSIGSPLVMSVESANGEPDPTSMFGDYAAAAANKFTSTGANLTLGSYANYAALANASYNTGQAIMSAGNPYFGLGNSWVLSAIALRNMYNSNGAIGTVARSTGQSVAFNQISNSVFAPGSSNNVPTTPAYSGGGTVNGSTPMMIGNSIGAFVGTYNFGPGIGTYNFGTKSWK